MSTLLQIQKKLQQSLAELAHLESTLVVHPESPSLRANMKSLQKLQKGYETQMAFITLKTFIKIATQLGI